MSQDIINGDKAVIGVAILGHGVVGSGVVHVLDKNEKNISKKAGKKIEVAKILDLREFPESPHADKFTKDFEEILSDENIDIVIECMGGLKPAYDFVKRSLLSGKSVVTSNKELVAEKGDELLEIAQEKNLNFLFEASVGGGIPILRPLDQCLAANEVETVAGILNGTTNFILNKMIEEDMDFDTALALAQKKGYAESDPTADVDGHDTCRKICILASLAFGYHVHPSSVKTKGIRSVSLDDVKYAFEWGGVIKLIGHASVKPSSDEGTGEIECFVEPMILPRESLLSDINCVYNGVFISGDVIGDVVFYGQGAGKLPTASAVVADVIDEVKHMEKRKMIYWNKAKENYVSDSKKYLSDFLIRISCGSKKSDVLSFFEKELSFPELISPQGVAENEIGLLVKDKSLSEIEFVIEKALTQQKLEMDVINIFRIGKY